MLGRNRQDAIKISIIQRLSTHISTTEEKLEKNADKLDIKKHDFDKTSDRNCSPDEVNLKVVEVSENEREISDVNEGEISDVSSIEQHQRRLTDGSRISLNTLVNPSCPMRSREIYTNVDKTIKTGSEILSDKTGDRIINSKPEKKLKTGNS